MLLAPAAKGPPPEPKRAVPERREAFEVSWYCVVVEVTLHDRFEPFASSRHGIVHARVELLLDLSQLGPHALADRLASHGKSPDPGSLRQTARTRSGASFLDGAPVQTLPIAPAETKSRGQT